MTIIKAKLIIHCSTKDSEKGKISILIIYVDDIILTRDDLDELANLKRRMT